MHCKNKEIYLVFFYLDFTNYYGQMKFFISNPQKNGNKEFYHISDHLKRLWGFATSYFRVMYEAHGAFWHVLEFPAAQWGRNLLKNITALIRHIKQQLKHSSVLFWILTWSALYSKWFLHLFPFSIQHFMDGNLPSFLSTLFFNVSCWCSSSDAESKHFEFLNLF